MLGHGASLPGMSPLVARLSHAERLQSARERSRPVQGPAGRLRGGVRGDRGGLSPAGAEVPPRRLAGSRVAGAHGPHQPGVGDAARPRQARGRRPRTDAQCRRGRAGRCRRTPRTAAGRRPRQPAPTPPGTTLRSRTTATGRTPLRRPAPAPAAPAPADRRRAGGAGAPQSPSHRSSSTDWTSGRSNAGGGFDAVDDVGAQRRRQRRPAAGQPVRERAQLRTLPRLVASARSPAPTSSTSSGWTARRSGGSTRSSSTTCCGPTDGGSAHRPANDKSRGLFRRR